MNCELDTYREELEAELELILSYWMQHTCDEEHGGFVGKISHDNRADASAPKGSVLNSRILWAFSSAYGSTGDERYCTMATRAFHYIMDHFIDREYGGVYWSVDAEGRPL